MEQRTILFSFIVNDKVFFVLLFVGLQIKAKFCWSAFATRKCNAYVIVLFARIFGRVAWRSSCSMTWKKR
jgi:hypothetical protein